jgi:hypothetical protein
VPAQTRRKPRKASTWSLKDIGRRVPAPLRQGVLITTTSARPTRIWSSKQPPPPTKPTGRFVADRWGRGGQGRLPHRGVPWARAVAGTARARCCSTRRLHKACDGGLVCRIFLDRGRQGDDSHHLFRGSSKIAY